MSYYFYLILLRSAFAGRYPVIGADLTNAQHEIMTGLFGPKERLLMQGIVESFLTAPGLWQPVHEVSERSPFVFFHQRKAGGSSIRKVLKARANRARPQLSTYIPCLTPGVPCDTYTLPSVQDRAGMKAVIAGHIPWGEPQNKFERMTHETATNFSCATNFREPLSRVVSCLEFRHGQEMNGNCVSDMDSELLHHLLTKPDRFGNSCLNEPFRIMSGVRADAFSDHLNICNPHNQSEQFGQLIGRHSDFVVALLLTLEHVKECSPLILELYDSYIMASRRFNTTGISFLTTYGKMQKTNVGKAQNKCESQPWRDSNFRMMICNTAIERVLYRAVLRKAACVFNGTNSSMCSSGFDAFL